MFDGWRARPNGCFPTVSPGDDGRAKQPRRIRFAGRFSSFLSSRDLSALPTVLRIIVVFSIPLPPPPPPPSIGQSPASYQQLAVPSRSCRHSAIELFPVAFVLFLMRDSRVDFPIATFDGRRDNDRAEDQDPFSRTRYVTTRFILLSRTPRPRGRFGENPPAARVVGEFGDFRFFICNLLLKRHDSPTACLTCR